MGQSDFWNYREKAQEVVGRLKGLKSIVKPLEDAVRASDDLAAMIEMADGRRRHGRRSAR